MDIDFYSKVIDLALISLPYLAYNLVKRYKFKLIRITMLSISIIYFLSYIYLQRINYNNEDIKILIIVIAVFTLFRAYTLRDDIRGSKIIELINLQKCWENKEYIFRPKDFTNEELIIIEKVVRNIFYHVNSNLGFRELGKQTVYIKKNQNAKSIRIVNILYSDKTEDLERIKSIYSKFAKENYGEVNLKEGFIPEIELRIVV